MSRPVQGSPREAAAPLFGEVADLVALMAAPAWATGPDGTVLAANPAAAALLDRPVADWVGLGDTALLVARQVARLRRARAGVGRDGAVRVRFRGCFLTGGGHPRLLDCSLTALAETRSGAVLVQVDPVAPSRVGTACSAAGTGPLSPPGAVLPGAAELVGFAEWSLDPDCGRIRVAEGMLAMLGHAPDGGEIDSAWLRARVHPEDRPAMHAVAARLIRGDDESIRIDCRLRHRDGRYLWVEASARRVEPGPGLRPVFCGVLSDVTHHKEHEAQLQQALFEARRVRTEAAKTEGIIRIAAEGAGFGHWTFDPVIETYWLDEVFSRTLGYRPGAIDTSRSGFRELLHPDDAEAARAAMDALVSGASERMHIDCRLRAADGTWRWFETSARLVSLSEVGLPPLVCGISRDITPRKTYEQELAHALELARQARDEAEAARVKQQLQATILRVSTEYSNVVPWHAVPSLGLFRADDHLAAMLGYPPGRRFTAAEFRNLIHSEDAPEALGRVDALYRRKLEAIAVEFRVRRGDGGWCWVSSKARWLDRAASGLPDMICGTLTEVTALKANETRLAEALAAAETARIDSQTREEMLRTSALCSGIAHWVVCPATGEGWIPDGTYGLLGYAPGAFPPQKGCWRGLIHEEDSVEAVALMRELLEGRSETYAHEHRLLHADGSYHWYRAVARRVRRAASGQPDLIAGALVSIDHVKENEARLAEAAEAARLAGERLNTLADNAPGALFIFLISPDGQFELPYFSAKLPALMGLSRAEIEADASALMTRVAPDHIRALRRAIATSQRGLTPFEMRLRVCRPEGGFRSVLVASLPFSREDGTVVWYGNVFDITDRLDAERRAAEAAEEGRRVHERLSSVAMIAPVGLYEFRRQADGSIDFPYTTPKFEDIMGLSREEIGMRSCDVLRRIDPEDLPHVLASIEDSARDLTLWSQRFRIRHPERGLIWLSGASAPRRQEDGTILWAGALHDVTGDVQREAELRQAHRLAEAMRAENERQALHDGLTGLPNRRFYDRVLSSRIEAARAGQGPRDCVLIRIDLDHFKYVNDTLGHEAGDRVLIRVAEVLRQMLRAVDFVARIGGDEFSILLGPDMNQDNARELIERVQGALSRPLTYEGRLCRFGASFGIAHTGDITELGAELQLFADAALYRAKEGGRNRMEFFTAELHRNILNDRRIAVELHEALERDEFEPFFQPQIAAEDGRLVGAETLLRWRHPEKGLLSPDDFMHVAEQLRIVPEIDRIMMRKTRSALARWQDQGLVLPKISFNVSSGRMHDPDVVSLARSMAGGGTRVTFELLESILVEEESDAFRFHLDQIREAGIDIEIDDFGSGHASIIGVMEIAPKALKIDRRIVRPVACDMRSRNLVRAIIEIAETLGIATVAEGVETEEQAKILRGVGCQVLQGYLFSHPLDEGDFLAFTRADLKKRA